MCVAEYNGLAGGNLDYAVLVRTKRSGFFAVACFGPSHEIRHTFAVTLNLVITLCIHPLLYGDLIAMLIRQHYIPHQRIAASGRGLQLGDLRNDACEVDAERRVQLLQYRKIGNPFRNTANANARTRRL